MMESIDLNEQWHQLRENYVQMTEDELTRIAGDAYNLTPIAQEALQAEIKERKLAIQLQISSPATEPDFEEPDPELPPLDTEDDLVSVSFFWDEASARRTKGILDEAFIPSYLGPDNVSHIDDFKSSFSAGVHLKVRSVDRARACSTLANHSFEDQDELDPDEGKEFAIVCPKCHSTEVVFEEKDPQAVNPIADTKFNWTCGDCGHQWKDDGIEQAL
jgi:DNA-directed RNA polymerase subunit M/transcription elongation factor TFIIS